MNGSVFQRDAFIEEIFVAAKNDRDIFFVSADFGAPALDRFREELPNQFFHSGISEQHMIDMAAGLALSGKKVYVYAMAPFITLRCLEQTKCSLALMNLPVTILAVGVGLGYADAGPTHYSTEDIACLRSIVGLEVVSPCDELSSRFIAKRTIEAPSLRVVRLERHALPLIYSSESELISYGHNELVKGEGVCVMSYGHLLHRILNARKSLPKPKFGVVDLFVIKPIDFNLVDILKTYDSIVTVEEQCLSGGFGSAVLEFLSDVGLKIHVKRLGLEERYYFENGGREFLLDEFGLSKETILEEISHLESAAL